MVCKCKGANSEVVCHQKYLFKIKTRSSKLKTILAHGGFDSLFFTYFLRCGFCELDKLGRYNETLILVGQTGI